MPSVLQSIQDTMTQITDQIGDLGPSPDAVDPAKVHSFVVHSTDFDGPLGHLSTLFLFVLHHCTQAAH